jgi:hypothetical protein
MHYSQNNSKWQSPLPNSTAVLVLGILSIVLFCCCYGIIGAACAIIALSMTRKAMIYYRISPENYTVSSVNNLNAGRICAIIGLTISGLYLLLMVIVLLFYGFVFTSLLGPTLFDKLF